MLYSHLRKWRGGKRRRNMYLASLENYPKWQTAVKFSLRESQCEPDELCISIEHEMEWGAPHQPWFFFLRQTSSDGTNECCFSEYFSLHYHLHCSVIDWQFCQSKFTRCESRHDARAGLPRACLCYAVALWAFNPKLPL